jgi:hypothetical protein
MWWAEFELDFSTYNVSQAQLNWTHIFINWIWAKFSSLRLDWLIWDPNIDGFSYIAGEVLTYGELWMYKLFWDWVYCESQWKSRVHDALTETCAVLKRVKAYIKLFIEGTFMFKIIFDCVKLADLSLFVKKKKRKTKFKIN